MQSEEEMTKVREEEDHSTSQQQSYVEQQNPMVDDSSENHTPSPTTINRTKNVHNNCSGPDVDMDEVPQVPPTKVDVEPINSKQSDDHQDKVAGLSENHSKNDDIVTSPPIKLRIRQSFHDGTLDHIPNSDMNNKKLLEGVHAAQRVMAEVANSLSTPSEPPAAPSEPKQTVVEPPPVAVVVPVVQTPPPPPPAAASTILVDSAMQKQRQQVQQPSFQSARETDNKTLLGGVSQLSPMVGRPTKTKGNIKKLMQKKRQLESPIIQQMSPLPEGQWRWSLGDLLWAKVSGHPWWPCLVADDPFDKAHRRCKEGSTRRTYHVQYFGNEGERGWIIENSTIEFKGKQEFMKYCQAMILKNKKDKEKYTIKVNRRKAWEFAVSSAQQALPMDPDDRIQNFAFVYTPLPPSPVISHGASKRNHESSSSGDMTPSSKRNRRSTNSSETASDRHDNAMADRDATQFSVFVRVRRNDMFTKGDLSDVEDHGTDTDTRIMNKLLQDWEVMHASEKARFIPMGVNVKPVIAKSGRVCKPTTKKVVSDLQSEEFKDIDKQNKKPRKSSISQDAPGTPYSKTKKPPSSLMEKKTPKSAKVAKVKRETPKVTPREHKVSETDDEQDEEIDTRPQENNHLPDITDKKKIKQPHHQTEQQDSGGGGDETKRLEIYRLHARRGIQRESICSGCELLSRSSEDKFYHCHKCTVSFHHTCDKNGVIDRAEDGTITYTCSECAKGSHVCFVCKKSDSSTEKCQVTSCSHFYHRKCILELRCASCIDLDMKPRERHRKKSTKKTAALAAPPVITAANGADHAPKDITNGAVVKNEVQDVKSNNVSEDDKSSTTDILADRDSTRSDDVKQEPLTDTKEIVKLEPQSPLNNDIKVEEGTEEESKNRLGFICPQHKCQLCEAETVDNPDTMEKAMARLSKANKSQKDRLFRCIRCPNAFHTGDFCLAAGSLQIGKSSYVVCSDHFIPMLKSHPHHSHTNVSWCFICSTGGSLICCESCPAAFHVKCLLTPPKGDGSFFCNDCEAGKRPTYGMIIWVKIGSYRWWPCQIIHTRDVPNNIRDKPHQVGEFAVFFFGSNDFFWTHRARVIPFAEDDKGKDNNKKKALSKVYAQAVILAQQAFRKVVQHKEERLACIKDKQDRKPPYYKHIKTNFPIGNVQIYKNTEDAPICECSKNVESLADRGMKPCDDKSDCINRLMLYECIPSLCHAQCANQRMTKREYVSAQPFKTEGRGWGLKANQDIKQGTFTFEYVGDLVDKVECDKRMKSSTENFSNDFYMLTLDGMRIIDAGPRGNLSRFMNHSCDPNCAMQKWHVHGDVRINIFALRDISSGSELTFNYNFDSLGNDKLKCRCGSSICSGYLGLRPKENNGTEAKKPRKKKKKITKNFGAKKDDTCYRCNRGGELMMCDRKVCPKSYHLACLKMTKVPTFKWICPWHHCDECGRAASHRCVKCPNSFCVDHATTSIFNSEYGLVCMEHDLTGIDTNSTAPPPPSLPLATIYSRSSSTSNSPYSSAVSLNGDDDNDDRTSASTKSTMEPIKEDAMFEDSDNDFKDLVIDIPM